MMKTMKNCQRIPEGARTRLREIEDTPQSEPIRKTTSSNYIRIANSRRVRKLLKNQSGLTETLMIRIDTVANKNFFEN